MSLSKTRAHLRDAGIQLQGYQRDAELAGRATFMTTRVVSDLEQLLSRVSELVGALQNIHADQQ